jgi:hypothetical protein
MVTSRQQGDRPFRQPDRAALSIGKNQMDNGRSFPVAGALACQSAWDCWIYPRVAAGSVPWSGLNQAACPVRLLPPRVSGRDFVPSRYEVGAAKGWKRSRSAWSTNACPPALKRPAQQAAVGMGFPSAKGHPDRTAGSAGLAEPRLARTCREWDRSIAGICWLAARKPMGFRPVTTPQATLTPRSTKFSRFITAIADLRRSIE